MELEEEINTEKLEDFKAPDIDPLRKKKNKKIFNICIYLIIYNRIYYRLSFSIKIFIEERKI